MIVRSAARRLATAFVMLLVPTLALLAFNPWPQQLLATESEALLASSLAAADGSSDPSEASSFSESQADEPMTLKDWDDTNGKGKAKGKDKPKKPKKEKKTPKGKAKGHQKPPPPQGKAKGHSPSPPPHGKAKGHNK
jgi:hypothetical protein